jgi:UDP-4-amino-4-deoxy-L-arabinose formyltransferase/UDP-glucuronic acid dehydrogenase (UDP-4-keto-hexauronic acid decarboxylating)
VSVVVLAYHEMGCTGLRALLRRGVPVSAVFTYRDDPDENCWFGSVASLAKGAGIPVFLTEEIHDARWIGHLRALRPDVLFSFYYRHIVRRPILEIPRLGAYNLHGSLLPRYRGRCPVNWQLVNGERESGVTLHVMTPRADGGDIVGQERVAVGPDDTAGELYAKLNTAADVLLERTLDDLLAGRAPRTPQDESQATVFGGRRPEDGRIDWTWPRARIHDLVRAVAPPWPGAFGELPDGRLMVWRTSRQPPAGAPPLPPGGLARLGERLVAGAGDGPIELLSWSAPAGRVPRTGERLSLLAPAAARPEVRS